MISGYFFTIFTFTLCLTVNTQRVTEEYLNKYRALESFVELKGGKFMMGVSDRFGFNGEYPQRFAIVKPFR